MDLELKHLGQTLALGGFAVYSSLELVRVCRATRLQRFFEVSNDKVGFQHIAVYLALVLAIGVVLQDVSKDIVAQHDSPHNVHINQDGSFDVTLKERSWLNRQVSSYVLLTERELRFRSLFDVTTSDKNEILAVPKPIFLELLEVGEHNAGLKKYLDEINKLNPSKDSRVICIKPPQVEATRSAINSVFYEAKNRVYREDTYYHELSDISDLMDFSRSLTFLCLIGTVLYSCFFCLACIGPAARLLRIHHAERSTLFLLSLLYAVGIWLAGVAYRSESTDYDLRIFGYYISYNVDPTENVTATGNRAIQ